MVIWASVLRTMPEQDADDERQQVAKASKGTAEPRRGILRLT